MEQKSIILNKEQSRIFNANMEWDAYVSENHIRDPFKEQRENWKNFTKTIRNSDGSTTIIIDDKQLADKKKELKEYIPLFIAEREIWIGQYLLKNYGYDTLSYFAQTHSNGETASSYDRKFWEWFERIFPCDSKEGQCHIFCPNFNNCDKEI